MAIFDRFRRNKNVNPSANVMQDVQNIDSDEGYEVTKVREEDQRISTTLAYPSNDSIHQFLAAPVASDKFKRLNEYRAMSNHVEVSDAIDEVCDSVYSIDELGNFLNLDVKNDKKFTDRQRKILADEFKKFVDLYDFEKNIFNYARTFVVEGELAFENVIL